MKRRTFCLYVAVALAAAGAFQTAPFNTVRTVRAQQASQPQRILLDKYCVTCHNQRAKAAGQNAGLALDLIDLTNIPEGAEVWEKVVGKLRSGAMPPAGLPRPDKTAYDSLSSWLEGALDRAAEAHPNPGRTAIHRLNRAEYTNAVRDLLSLEIDERALLPADDSGYGFDNIGDVLSVSPALLERYMLAAVKISRLAVGDPSMRPVIQTYKVPPGFVQDDRASEDLPFGSRGGIAVHHYFPLDGEYVFKLRLQRTFRNEVRGLGAPNQIDLRLDHAVIKQFTVGGDGPRAPYSAIPVPEAYEQIADDDLEIRVLMKAGTHLVAAAFPKKSSAAPESALEPRLSVSTNEYAGDRDAEMGVDNLTISGPYGAKAADDTPSRRQVFVCRPASSQDEEPCARKILSTLARRAYRRPATDEDVQSLLGFYKAGRHTGTFDAGIQLALRALLVDPDFLFRIERDPENLAPSTAYRLSDLELASRLSFFLWSSIPDAQLLDVAVQGKLKDPAVLERQVKRMLGDARASALVSNFAGQWLYLRNLREAAPDPTAFPDFDDNLREALQRETELFVEEQLRDDRSVVDLLTANYTFANERLARHYGIPNVYGSRFRRVTFSDDTRLGLLGQGSILLATSYAHRTSPTLRGKWVLQNLLGAPPPPPPPNVPALEEDERVATPRSVRERMEQHRKDPVCASCHARMDPLGFALENFDAIGRWRTSEGNTPIDTSGVLPDGTKVQGPSGLRTFLLAHREQFVSAVTEKLLTYALGRGVEYYDGPAIRKIMRESAPSDYRWSSLVLGIVKSTPFQMRRSLGS